MRVCEQILDLARWAPSGDNTQPWRFEIVADDHIAVHGHDTRDWCLYDFDGHASHMAHGALLETLRIGATGHGLSATWQLRPDSDATAPVYDVKLSPLGASDKDPLFPFILSRTVQRRPMRRTPLTDGQREALRTAVGPGFEVRFFEGSPQRRKVARLLWDSAYVRLTCPEAYQVHKDIIEWNAQFSKDRIPDQAVGVDALTARLMRWVMHSWKRVEFFNTYCFGTIAPRVQLDVLPAMFCAAHVLILAKTPPATIEDYVRAGIAMQRLWLTVTAQGLYLQPEMTPVIFRWYARAQRSFSGTPGISTQVADLATHFERISTAEPKDAFAFFCRVGHSKAPGSRSVRKDIGDLMWSASLRQPH